MIHSLFSTLPTFKTIVGLKPGLNVLLAQKTMGASDKKTRNRAGKTSFTEVIHLLTGSNVDKESIFRTPELLECTFGMDFDLKNARTVVERCGNSKAKIALTTSLGGARKSSATDWTELLGEEMFGLTSLTKTGSKPPTFRSLFGYFVRRQESGAFTTPEKQANKQGPGDMQMALMFLLGLDWQIARDWEAIRLREKTLKELRKAAATEAFSSIIGKAADLRTRLTLQESRLKKLLVQTESFRVLPEYRELEVESATLTRQLNDLANGNTIDFGAMRDLEQAMASEVAPALGDLQAVYEEAGVVLPGLVARRYEDVTRFHQSVVRNRNDYLITELHAVEQRIKLRDNKKVPLDLRRGEVLGILKSHGALDQFLKLQGEVGRVEAEVSMLRRRFEAAEQLEGVKSELVIAKSQLMNRLRRNFAEQSDRLGEAILAFEETSGRLYESAGSMTIDDTTNGPEFKFPMQGQRSKGIKNMQIFCFDMMLMQLCAKRRMGPGFLVHDSHLFDGVDGRQVISALKLGSELATELGFQYIVTMNEDDAFKETIAGFDLNDFVLPTRLTDATVDGGLFGIRFG
jgi:uncharacterized protein YydD (DUF2326 family)